MAGDAMFYFDRGRLLALGRERRRGYADAKPFPHAVIDEFLPPRVLERVLEEFPGSDDAQWTGYSQDREKNKLATTDLDALGPYTRQLLAELNSSAMAEFLEELTGIDGLIPDPYFSGGGLHQTAPGGFLKIHVDFNLHQRLCLDRCLNMLIYLNEDWREEYGGHLELWDRGACVQRVLPVFNRCVIFTLSSTSFHGHPEPLACPEDRQRRSLALYYYTALSPVADGDYRTTLWKEQLGRAGIVKRLLPPIVLDGVRALRSRLGRSSRDGPRSR